MSGQSGAVSSLYSLALGFGFLAFVKMHVLNDSGLFLGQFVFSLLALISLNLVMPCALFFHSNCVILFLSSSRIPAYSLSLFLNRFQSSTLSSSFLHLSSPFLLLYLSTLSFTISGLFSLSLSLYLLSSFSLSLSSLFSSHFERVCLYRSGPRFSPGSLCLPFLPSFLNLYLGKFLLVPRQQKRWS